MSIVGIGNALVDIVSEIPSDETLVRLGLPKGSMTLVDENRHDDIFNVVQGLSQTVAAGGSAANTINGLAQLGAKTIFVGKIADDELGKMFREDQIQSNINPMLLLADDCPTGKCISLVSPCKERTMATFLGAASTLQGHEITLPTGRLVYIEGYLLYNHDLIESIMKQAHGHGVKIALDLASYNVVEDNLEFLKYLISKYVDIVFANEEEVHAYTGLPTEEAFNQLASECEIAIVKIGAKGSLVARGDERCRIGVIDAVPIDKTGAGDLYAAGFIYGLINDHGLKTCGDFGAILSSKVVEVMGPKMHDATWDVIRTLVARVAAGEQIVKIA